jgi:hypothetical protein
MLRGMRARLLVVFFLVFLVFAGCKKQPTILGDADKPAPAKCSADADCQIIALNDCCACCSNTEIHAVAKDAKYERHCDGHCKVCTGPGSKDGKAVSCETNPKPGDFTAVCRAGTCAYASKK